MPSNYVEIAIKATDSARPDLAELRRQLNDLKGRVAVTTVDVKDKAAMTELARLNYQLASLSGRVAKPSIDLQGALRAQMQLAGLDAAFGRLTTRLMEVDRGLKQVNQGGDRAGGWVSRLGSALMGLVSGRTLTTGLDQMAASLA